MKYASQFTLSLALLIMSAILVSGCDFSGSSQPPMSKVKKCLIAKRSPNSTAIFRELHEPPPPDAIAALEQDYENSDEADDFINLFEFDSDAAAQRYVQSQKNQGYVHRYGRYVILELAAFSPESGYDKDFVDCIS